MSTGVRGDVTGPWRCWTRLVAGTYLVAAGGVVTLEVIRSFPTGRFVGGVLAFTLLTSLTFGRIVRRTHRESGPQRLTLATWVTVSRAGVLAVLAGFVFIPSDATGWLAGGLFALAAVLDAVDGRLARMTDSITELGGRVDTEVDGLTVFLGSLLAVLAGTAPVAFLLVGIARPTFAVGCWWRRRNGRPVAPLPSSRLRGSLGASAMVVIWLALLPVPGAERSWLLTTAVAVPFLINFGRDWLAVTAVS